MRRGVVAALIDYQCLWICKSQGNGRRVGNERAGFDVLYTTHNSSEMNYIVFITIIL